jgi:predicted alpha/beta superfamily hydrolase
MKNLILVMAAGFLLAACQNREESLSENINAEQIVIGQMDSLHSEILDEMRNIWVYVPNEQTGALYGMISYPVLYLLDGPGHFHAVTGMLKSLADNGLVPRMVVVGIPNTDRTRDLTPTHRDIVFGDSAFVKTSGGGGAFLDFMEEELIPYVEAKYPVTGYRTFVGHSFGGLAAVYSLLNRPQLFSNYVAIDPSLWWDDWVMVHQADSLFANPDLLGKSLYIGVANTMDDGMDINRVRSDTASSSNHIRSILSFISFVETGNSGLNFGWEYYEDDDHGSVPLITEYDALRFLFPWYRLRGLNEFFQEETAYNVEELKTALNDHYTVVSEHFGYQVLPPESDVNSLGYNMLTANKPDMARSMFEMNIKNYPGSANVFDSMGDFCLAESDSLEAIKNFSKALELGNNPITREKLNQLISAEN